ncbi:MAG: DUF4446 family protein [Halanaerobiales bacterium]|nr:DUF4446 family protein [Halanaerobiales bacterium]
MKLDFIPVDQTLPFLIQTLLIVVLAIVIIVTFLRTSKLTKIIKKVTHNQDGMSIEAIIHQYYSKIDSIQKNQQEIMKEQAQIVEILKNCFSKSGIVRFNPFDQVGGDQSFVIALLDQEGNGIVMSSLYGRNQSRFYGKPIVNGKSSYTLSDEEKKAIQQALKSN